MNGILYKKSMGFHSGICRKFYFNIMAILNSIQKWRKSQKPEKISWKQPPVGVSSCPPDMTD
jgi:hypothetical protein